MYDIYETYACIKYKNGEMWQSDLACIHVKNGLWRWSCELTVNARGFDPV